MDSIPRCQVHRCKKEPIVKGREQVEYICTYCRREELDYKKRFDYTAPSSYIEWCCAKQRLLGEKADG
jgi:hypothetical protein